MRSTSLLATPALSARSKSYPWDFNYLALTSPSYKEGKLELIEAEEAKVEEVEEEEEEEAKKKEKKYKEEDSEEAEAEAEEEEEEKKKQYYLLPYR